MKYSVWYYNEGYIRLSEPTEYTTERVNFNVNYGFWITVIKKLHCYILACFAVITCRVICIHLCVHYVYTVDWTEGEKDQWSRKKWKMENAAVRNINKNEQKCLCRSTEWSCVLTLGCLNEDWNKLAMNIKFIEFILSLINHITVSGLIYL